ncbi:MULTISPECIES: YlbF family regulator [Cytobacillus]|uniref:YlbF family regulator n=1 Tax=Cytobacillus stercorigallinarum TaxID=2762240 RepID=A0ABR8QMW5_9BACI|nr:YlbF family regulator [Cytobacillus stercorigallinarum]MBD7936845.1 YlbF family regulator [Cytobacillus stercorigallinarum]
MLATLERLEILDVADEIVTMIVKSEEAAQYKQCLKEMQSNSETQKKIRQFVEMKDLYEDVQRFGKYHPDYKRVTMSIRQLKREMDMDPYVAAFRQSETELQSLLDEISVIISHSVSQHIKVPTGNPFFDNACSGGCGSGGACSCSA